MSIWHEKTFESLPEQSVDPQLPGLEVFQQHFPIDLIEATHEAITSGQKIPLESIRRNLPAVDILKDVNQRQLHGATIPIDGKMYGIAPRPNSPLFVLVTGGIGKLTIDRKNQLVFDEKGQPKTAGKDKQEIRKNYHVDIDAFKNNLVVDQRGGSATIINALDSKTGRPLSHEPLTIVTNGKVLEPGIRMRPMRPIVIESGEHIPLSEAIKANRSRRRKISAVIADAHEPGSIISFAIRDNENAQANNYEAIVRLGESENGKTYRAHMEIIKWDEGNDEPISISEGMSGKLEVVGERFGETEEVKFVPDDKNDSEKLKKLLGNTRPRNRYQILDNGTTFVRNHEIEIEVGAAFITIAASSLWVYLHRHHHRRS